MSRPDMRQLLLLLATLSLCAAAFVVIVAINAVFLFGPTSYKARAPAVLALAFGAVAFILWVWREILELRD